VQILSHQAKIATKVEIFPGLALHGGVVADHRDAEYRRLGCVLSLEVSCADFCSQIFLCTDDGCADFLCADICFADFFCVF
jgi:hypothetical protein